LEQGRDGGSVGAFKSDFGETVLRDLHGGARLLHLHAQSLHLGDREAGVMSDDDDVRGLEDLVERRDELLFFRSIHSKLSPVGVCVRRATAGLHLPSAKFNESGRTTLTCPARTRTSRA